MGVSSLFSVSVNSAPEMPYLGGGRRSAFAGLFAVILTMVCSILPATAETEVKNTDSKSYNIVFRGNAAISDGALGREAARELEAFEKEGHRPADIDDAAFQMQTAYRNDGYAFATVDYQIEKKQGLTAVTFLISEGPRVTVRDIVLSGNQAFDDSSLKEYFAEDRSGLLSKGELVFIRSDVELAVDKIRQRYLTQGYLDAVVEAPALQFTADRSQVDITITIVEGTQYTIHRIDMRGDVLANAQKELEQIQQELLGQPYFNRKKLLLQTRILDAYGNRGYPDVAVEIERQSGGKPGQVVLEVTVASGPQVTIAAVEIKGNQRTRPDFIRNRIRLKAGDRYDLSLQKQSFRDLYRTGIFSKVDFDLQKTADPDKRLLVVNVEETRTRELFLEPGWGSYEKLRLRVGFQDKNIFGSGRIFKIQATGSLKARSLVGSLSDPFFFNSDIRADLTAFYNHREEPSFTREDTGMSFGLSKDLTENVLTSAQYMIRNTDITDVDRFEQQSEGNYDFASIKGQVTYDTRNDFFFPTTGQRIFGAVEQAHEVLGSDINLTRLTGGVRRFFRLTPGTVLGVRYAAGLLLPGQGEVTLPLSERFFNGGENSVRSFKESELGAKDPSGEPVGGYGRNVFSIELRQRLIGNLIGALFFDYGNIAPNRSRSEQGKPPYESRSDVISDTLDDFFKDFRPGVGFGLQYLLPIGPARIDFAFNPDRDSQRGEDSFVIQFSVGTAF